MQAVRQKRKGVVTYTAKDEVVATDGVLTVINDTVDENENNIVKINKIFRTPQEEL